MDHQLFLAINGLAGKLHLLDVIGKFIGSDYFLYAFVLLVVLLWFKRGMHKRVYLALGSTVIAYAITGLIKHLVFRPRPFEVLKVHQLIIDTERGNSFPSGHSTVYFALAAAFWGTEYFWPFLTFAVLGAVGRVFVGVHYPLDVLAGAAVGSVTVLLLRKFFQRHFR